jgi:large subunit ribosomal protein L10
MPSQKNLDQIQNLKEKFEKAKSIVLADYAGLPVHLQQDLRAKVIEADGELIVAKNTLLKLACQELNYPIDTLTDSFTGPTITLFAYQDEIAPIKALAMFAKINELPTIKAGYLNKDPLTKEQVESLAKLPTKVELIAKTVATIKAPLTGFVNVLSGNLKNLIYVLTAISKKGGE